MRKFHTIKLSQFHKAKTCWTEDCWSRLYRAQLPILRVKVRHTKQKNLPLGPKAIMVSSVLGILLVPERMTRGRKYKGVRKSYVPVTL